MKTNKLFLLLIGFIATFNVSFAQERANIREDWFYICSKLDPDYCIDVKGGKAVKGQNIQLYRSNETYAQLWYFYKQDNGAYILFSALAESSDDGFVVGIAEGNIRNDQNIELQKYNGSKAQMWYITKDSNTKGYYMIRSAKNDEYVMTLNQGDVCNGSNIKIRKDANSKNQKWKLCQ